MTTLGWTEKLGTEANEDLIGTAHRDRLGAFGGKDRLYAKGGDDQLDAGAGDDLLDGGPGADTMSGGEGNDVYRVDDPMDVVNEEISSGVDAGGIDLVESSVTYTLGAFLENLTLTGTATINGTGNELANKVTGNDADNVLVGLTGSDVLRAKGGDDTAIGGPGADTVTGGDGSDTFVLGPADVTGADRVVDFTRADRLAIYGIDYGLADNHSLVHRELEADYFAVVPDSKAQGTAVGHGQFLYSVATTSGGPLGTLRWDADGAGTAHSGIVVATFAPVDGRPVQLSASQIVVMKPATAGAALNATTAPGMVTPPSTTTGSVATSSGGTELYLSATLLVVAVTGVLWFWIRKAHIVST